MTPARMTIGFLVYDGLQALDLTGPQDVFAPALDTLLIPGGQGSRREMGHTELLDWIRKRAAGTRRMVSVCTGLYILGATGLLESRRATTH